MSEENKPQSPGEGASEQVAKFIDSYQSVVSVMIGQTALMDQVAPVVTPLGNLLANDWLFTYRKHLVSMQDAGMFNLHRVYADTEVSNILETGGGRTIFVRSVDGGYSGFVTLDAPDLVKIVRDFRFLTIDIREWFNGTLQVIAMRGNHEPCA